jgi:spermidine/putrescine transport system ATP-binding protein
MSDYAVELRGVNKTFPGGAVVGRDVLAVRDVNLAIRQGEFFTMLGPSGCGKTTTLRMIAGFELPTSGEVLIQGQPVTRVPPYRRPVNTVFQSYALFPHLTILQNVAFGLAVKRVPRAERERRAMEALELVQLPGVANRKPGQLSGGQQQRVALARALVNRPAVLLLDEPLGALDLKLRKAMQLELKQLQTQVGITFIYVTHDQEEALTMSDRIAVMSRGSVLQVGSATEIYEEPANQFVADFIGETNFISGTVEAVNGYYAEFEGGGLRFVANIEPGLQRGARATLAVRPERIRLTADRPDDTPNVFKGRVVGTVYVGTDTRYLVELAPTVSVQVRKQNVVPVGMPALEGPVDFDVWISWPSDSARVLAD